MKLGALYTTHAGGERCLLPKVWKTVSAWERMRGLLGRSALQSGEGLLLEPCASVHTIGMHYPLDLAFIDERGLVRKLVRGLRPWRCSSVWNARATLEMSLGQIDACGLREGDVLAWREKIR